MRASLGRVVSVALLSALLGGLTPGRLEAGGQARIDFQGLRQNMRLVGGEHFSAHTLRHLVIVVHYRDLRPGRHTQRLELYAPSGALYQVLASEVTLAGGRGRGASQRPDAWERVEAVLPVSGTWITEHSLFGAWRVEVWVDQEPSPLATGVFVLTP